MEFTILLEPQVRSAAADAEGEEDTAGRKEEDSLAEDTPAEGIPEADTPEEDTPAVDTHPSGIPPVDSLLIHAKKKKRFRSITRDDENRSEKLREMEDLEEEERRREVDCTDSLLGFAMESRSREGYRGKKR